MITTILMIIIVTITINVSVQSSNHSMTFRIHSMADVCVPLPSLHEVIVIMFVLLTRHQMENSLPQGELFLSLRSNEIMLMFTTPTHSSLPHEEVLPWETFSK